MNWSVNFESRSYVSGFPTCVLNYSNGASDCLAIAIGLVSVEAVLRDDNNSSWGRAGSGVVDATFSEEEEELVENSTLFGNATAANPHVFRYTHDVILGMSLSGKSTPIPGDTYSLTVYCLVGSWTQVSWDDARVVGAAQARNSVSPVSGAHILQLLSVHVT